MTPKRSYSEKIKIIIPTFNAANYFPALWSGLNLQGISASQILIIDSSSSDGTADLFSATGASVVKIPQSEFNHGGTRRMAAEIAENAEFLIFLTQDAIPSNSDTFSNILRAFDDERVGMAYGCQLPRDNAGAIERHARSFNYPLDVIETRTMNDRARLGVKTTFCSDSFAAYRHQALEQIGGFPEDAYFAEDQILAGKMLMQGWSLSYRGDAYVKHSHGYSIGDDFRRYFDIGIFHARNQWMLDSFGRAEGQGLKFVSSEIRYLTQNAFFSIPSAIIRTVAKYAGYRMGLKETFWPNKLKRLFSMSPYYWSRKRP